MTKEKSMSKRQLMREERRRKEQRQRIFIIAGVVFVALILVIILAGPSIRNSLTPVGEFTQVAPVSYPDMDGTALGKADAPVLVEVYEDFQCPACKIYTEQIEPQVIQAFVVPGKVRYVFHQYPFLDDRQSVKESDQAANASLCAADQDRFWDYHAILYANSEEFQGAFTDKRLEAYAQSVGLDMDAFKQCYRDRRFKDQITEQQNQGSQAGVSGTPTVFVNGQRAGQPGYIASFEEISALINSALQASGG